MKKKLVVFLAALFTFAMTTTAFAADSPTAVVQKFNGNTSITASNTVATTDISAVDVKGNPTKVTVSTTDLSAAAKEKVANTAGIDSSKVIAAIEVSSTISEGSNVTLTYRINGIIKGEAYYVLHQKNDGTIEYIDAIAGNNSITFTLTSFSPVLIVKGTKPSTTDNVINNITNNNTTNNITNNNTTNNIYANNSVLAPKTGYSAAVYAAVAVISLLCAGYLLAKKIIR